MGYYTDYEIEVIDDSVDINVFINEFEKVTGYNIDSTLELNCEKWYSNHGDMLRLSKIFPDAIFKVSGVGEERGDEWVRYYKDGKSQNANIRLVRVMDDFDERKLK